MLRKQPISIAHLSRIPLQKPPKNDLRESETHFRALAELAPIIVWMTDDQTRCTYISRYWKDFTGRSPKKDLGFRWVDAIHPEDQNRAAQDLIEATRTRQSCLGEYRLRRANGEYTWFHDHGVPYFRTDGSYAGHVGTRIDIATHKNQNKEQAKIQDSLLLGQEAERKRIARELHDDIGQKLALLGVGLGEIEELLTNASESSALRTKLKEIRDSVDTIASDTHRISHNLHPSILTHLGLTPALRRLCKEISLQTQIAIEFVGRNVSDRIPPEIATALFRIGQESLANVAKHSGTRVARVELSQSRGALHLVIADSGKGFHVHQTNGKGLGLISTRERVRMIGGRIEITSEISKGTTVEVHVPVIIRGTRS